MQNGFVYVDSKLDLISNQVKSSQIQVQKTKSNRVLKKSSQIKSSPGKIRSNPNKIKRRFDLVTNFALKRSHIKVYKFS